MIITELKPFALKLSDEEEELDEDDPLFVPKEDVGLDGDDAGKGPDVGFGLDDDMIETPGAEEL
ncbi:hypothetical protein D4R51_03445 [bacterium]|nr:MAG: hypothetical protein D4R51_03445 [bacterium]